MTKINLIAGFLAVVIGVTPVLASDDTEGQAKERKEHPKLSEYQATGEKVLCVRTSRIRRTDVLDDYTILFHMFGKKTYVNRLPHRCFGLGFNRSFSYTLSTSLLCNVDIITVFENTHTGASCGLGEFEELIPASDPEDQTDDQPE